MDCPCVCHTFKTISIPVVCLQCDMDSKCSDERAQIRRNLLAALETLPRGVHATVVVYFPDDSGVDMQVTSTLPHNLVDKMLLEAVRGIPTVEPTEETLHADD